MRGFWSYARNDDTTNKVSALRGEVERILSEVLGQDVTLYHDTTHTRWGDDWQERINTELEKADFLIAVVTPWYLNRKHCRHEFLEARRRGTQVFPLYYRKAPLIENESHRDESLKSKDEEKAEAAKVAAEICRLQRQDFHPHRDDDLTSSESQKFINSMADKVASKCSP